jgi:phosphoribosylformylglycinamidine cyclo-ligase
MTTYRDAGVNIQRGDEFVKRIGPLVRSTFRPEVMGDLGGFGGLFRFSSDRYREPILVSGTDGVGTKVKLARMMNRHDTIGRYTGQWSGTAIFLRLFGNRAFGD